LLTENRSAATIGALPTGTTGKDRPMKRSVLVLIALGATAVLLVPTMATQFQSDGTDTLNGTSIVLEPADGPNGKYAVLNEDDEIELLLTESNPDLKGDGVNPDTVTPIKQVFTINNTGEETAEVWITDDADNVRFFRGDEVGNSIEGPTNSVNLTASETIAVGILVDTTDPDHDVEDASTFTIHATPVDDDDSTTETPEFFDDQTTTAVVEETTHETHTESPATLTPTPGTATATQTTTQSTPEQTETTDLTAEQTGTTADQVTPTTRSTPGTTTPLDRAGEANATSDSMAPPVGLPIGTVFLILGILAGARAWFGRT
jgi:hypothetical protein